MNHPNREPGTTHDRTQVTIGVFVIRQRTFVMDPLALDPNQELKQKGF